MRDREGARKLIEDPAVQPGPADIVAAADLLTSAAVVDLAEGDRERARRRLGEALDAEGRYPRNQLAERVWFVATLLGPEAAGGPEAVEDARQTLEQARWLFAFRTAELAAEAVAQLQHA
jgi:hypothetical protein